MGRRSKTFFVSYRFNGRRTLLSIGHFPGSSLSYARKLAAEKLSLVDKGVDPKVQVEDSGNDHLFSELWVPYNEKVKRDVMVKKTVFLIFFADQGFRLPQPNENELGQLGLLLPYPGSAGEISTTK